MEGVEVVRGGEEGRADPLPDDRANEDLHGRHLLYDLPERTCWDIGLELMLFPVPRFYTTASTRTGQRRYSPENYDFSDAWPSLSRSGLETRTKA